MSPTEEDDDWRKLTDVGERRRVQNRIAQRNYRRNIKRQLQQLKMLNQGLSFSSPISKQQQQSSQMPSQQSIQFRKISSASNVLLPDLDTTDLPAAELSDVSSIQAVLFGGTEETETVSSMPDQEDCNVTSQQHDDSTAELDFMTPLTDLESKILILGRSTVQSSPSALSSQHTSSQNSNALQKAVIRGRFHIAELLVENGADVYTVDEQGNNILHLAAQFGYASLVSFALSHCLNVNGINVSGETPLHLAIENDHVEIVHMLLRAGADMEFQS